MKVTPMKAFDLYAKPSSDFEQKVPSAVNLLAQSAIDFGAITQASSLGAEDMVITHLLDSHHIDSEVFVLQTGKLHAQTLDLLNTVQSTYGQHRIIRIYEPDAAQAAEFEKIHGQDAMRRSIALRQQCCRIRKILPLERALAGKRAWITGLRREQSEQRAEILPLETDGHRIKINPLYDWTLGDVWHYIKIHNVPYNPLHDQFYPSIGCEPCTRAITPGEDYRSGRWWWENESAKECGLHMTSSLTHLQTTN